MPSPKRLPTSHPACDAILKASSFVQLPTILRLARNCWHIVLATFGHSFCYNDIGLILSVQGLLTPVVSAPLMPITYPA